MLDVQKLQEEWYAENASLGRDLGYPECCIKAFGNDHPTLLKLRQPTITDKMRYAAACINGQYTGFIPNAVELRNYFNPITCYSTPCLTSKYWSIDHSNILLLKLSK